jgi:sugar phosphate isomerase/epimerase
MNTEKANRLTRREVFATALGFAGAAAFGNRFVFAEPMATAKPSMRIGCGTVVFRKLPLQEALDRIRRAGFEYVEPQATGPWCPHIDPWKDDPAAFRRRVEELGFKGVSGLWSANGAILGDPKSVEGVVQSIRWAREAGIPVVQAGDGAKPEGMSDDDALRLLGDRLARILEEAEKSRVFLAIEPHGTFSLTAEGLKSILALSDSKWLGVNFDTANVHRATYIETAAGAYSWKLFGRPQDEVATLKAVVDRVVHVHVKDVAGPNCVTLGQGGVNISGCIDVLKRAGYTGVLSLETEGELDASTGQQMIERSRVFLVDLLAKGE